MDYNYRVVNVDTGESFEYLEVFDAIKKFKEETMKKPGCVYQLLKVLADSRVDKL